MAVPKKRTGIPLKAAEELIGKLQSLKQQNVLTVAKQF